MQGRPPIVAQLVDIGAELADQWLNYRGVTFMGGIVEGGPAIVTKVLVVDVYIFAR